jgi:sulfur transfer protein SufE
MTSIETIRDDFTLLDDWEDKYRYVIELGEQLPPFRIWPAMRGIASRVASVGYG